MAPSSSCSRRSCMMALFAACCVSALAIGFFFTPAGPVHLPYLSDTESQMLLKELLDTGKMQNLVNAFHSDAAIVSKHYPELSLWNHKFWTPNGQKLETDAVLRQVLYKHRSSDLPIPNVVHFYFFSERGGSPQLQFPGYLSVLGALWQSGADGILVWCNAQPVGKYWDLLVNNATAHGLLDRIVLASRPLVRSVFNRSVAVIHHRVDLMKLQTAITMGGMFMDSDSVIVRSLQPLRRYNCVIGRESPYGLSIGTLMAAPSSAFVLLWYMLYQTFRDNEWAVHSVLLPHAIWQRFPRMCHVENDTMVRPNWYSAELKLLYQPFDQLAKKSRWNWDKNYMVHLWRRERPSANETSVRTLNSMYGQVARYILYGTRRLL